MKRDREKEAARTSKRAASESDESDDPMEDVMCLVCKLDQDEDKTLLCDGCDGAYHLYCLDPPLKKLPAGDWYCSFCITARSTRKHQSTKIVKKKVAADEYSEESDSSPVIEKKKKIAKNNINGHIALKKVVENLPKPVLSQQQRMIPDLVPPNPLRVNSGKLQDDKLNIPAIPSLLPPSTGNNSRVSSIPSVRSISNEKINIAAVNAEWNLGMHNSIQSNKLLSHARLRLIGNGEMININIADQGILCKWGSYLNILEKEYTSDEAPINPFAIYDDDGNEIEDPGNSYDVSARVVATDGDLSWWGIRSEPLLLAILSSKDKIDTVEITKNKSIPQDNCISNSLDSKERVDETHKEKPKSNVAKSTTSCAYFRTKTGCRNGMSCLYIHDSNSATSSNLGADGLNEDRFKSSMSVTKHAKELKTTIVSRSRSRSRDRSRPRDSTRERTQLDSRNGDMIDNSIDEYSRNAGRDYRGDGYTKNFDRYDNKDDKYSKDRSKSRSRGRNDRYHEEYGTNGDRSNKHSRDSDKFYYRSNRDSDRYDNRDDKYNRDGGRNHDRSDKYDRDGGRNHDRSDKYSRDADFNDRRDDKYDRDGGRNHDRSDKYNFKWRPFQL